MSNEVQGMGSALTRDQSILIIVGVVGVGLALAVVIKYLYPAQVDHTQIPLPLAKLEANIDATAQQHAAGIMADGYALPDNPAYTLHDFKSSNFKREYEWTATNPLEPAHIDRLLGAVRRVIEGYCTRNNIDEARGDNFFLALRGEWQLIDDVSIAAERLWTSTETMDSGTGRNPEFCFVFSELLREDPASLARSCAIIARALNLNLIAGRTGSVAYPENGECWRGGGFDD
jgi:hypothetical protein